VDLLFSAAASLGQLAVGAPTATPLKTYTANARARFALSRTCAIYVEGLFYQYSVDPTLLVVAGMPGDFRRTSVRAGFDLSRSIRSSDHVAR
jgi:hypothetical protein